VKFEIRSMKHETISNDENSKRLAIAQHRASHMRSDFVLNFGFGACFEFRDSDFEFA